MLFVFLVLLYTLRIASVHATEHYSIRYCDDRRIPVEFLADCTRVLSITQKPLCEKFLNNQACRVAPSYEALTGIDLSVMCASITYRIYDQKLWPFFSRGARSLPCEIDALTEYSIDNEIFSEIGPHEAHEMLHQFQFASEKLAGLTIKHPLFLTSMMEAEKRSGAISVYQKLSKRLQRAYSNKITAFLSETKDKSDICMRNLNSVEALAYSLDPDFISKIYIDIKNVSGTLSVFALADLLDGASSGAFRSILTETCGLRK